MINEKIVPISPYGFRFPTETEMAIDETLKLCGISGEDASMIAIEVMKKFGKSDEISACCRCLAEEKLPSAQPEIIRCEECSRCQIDTIYHDYWCDGKKVCKEHYCGYAERRTDER